MKPQPSPDRMTARQEKPPSHGPRTAVGLVQLICMSGLAGMVDAQALILSGTFVSFMTGNTTRFGEAAANGNGARMLLLACYLLVFIAGNTIGTIINTRTRRQWPMLAIIIALLSTTALLALENGYAFLPVVLAMGLLNTCFEHAGGQSLSVTYITGTLCRIGKWIGGWIVGRETGLGWPQLIPWIGMVCGSVLGAFYAVMIGIQSLWLPVVFSLFILLLSLLCPREWSLHFLGLEKQDAPPPAADPAAGAGGS